MINNRQAGRRRGRNNNNNNSPRQNGGGGNRGNGDSGNRIDNRARGNAAQLLEKYRNLARDAQMIGDRVNAEYYLQFADHYFRVLADNRSRQEEQQQRFRRPDEGDQDSGYEGDEMADGGADEGDDYMTPSMQTQEQRPPRREREGARDGNRDSNRAEGTRRERPERAERPERTERPERAERAERPERAERAERSGAGRQDRQQRFANDDEDDVEIGLPGLPPAIGRIEVEPEEEARPVVTEEVVEEAPKPRRGRRPRQPEAAE